jgi:O-antigen ligase
MIGDFGRIRLPRQAWTWFLVVAVLVATVLLGQQASVRWLGLLVIGIGAALFLLRPVWGLPALVAVALLVPLEIGTGTDVKLNATSLLIPALGAIWLLALARHRHAGIVRSPANLPLLLFLAANLVSLLVGRATWDPLVPVSGNFLLVQLAQWAIFAFSALAFWLAANLITDEKWLWRLTATFALLAGGVAIGRLFPGLDGLLGRFTTIAFVRAPLWVLLGALAASQLLFNRNMSTLWKVYLLAVTLAVLAYAFVQQRESLSNWAGVAAVLGALLWLRYPRLRLPIVAVVLLLAMVGILFPVLYNFAGGDVEWQLSGGSRLALSQRVIEATLRNPITGLGPAAYRPYTRMQPLHYGLTFWIEPQINSHNNYVDIFSQSGLIGLGLFAWFVVELARIGARLRTRYPEGFIAGYVNGVLAVGVGALVIMMFADWILPFVYNIGFGGFQASVLVWVFMGGLVALDCLPVASTGLKQGAAESSGVTVGYPEER